MPNSKISALTSATTPLAGTETLPIVQSSTTKQVSVANLTAGRAITCTDVTASGELVSTTNNARISLYRSAGINYFDWSSGQTLAFGTQTTQGGAGRVNKVNFTDAGNIEIANGNLVQGTAAKGVNFTANTPAAGMTSQLLNWYEEGSYTPTVTAASGSITSYTATAAYTRIGRQIAVVANVTITNAGTGAGSLNISLPFTASGSFAFSGAGRENVSGVMLQVNVSAAGTVMNVWTYTNATAIATSAQFRATVTYFV